MLVVRTTHIQASLFCCCSYWLFEISSFLFSLFFFRLPWTCSILRCSLGVCVYVCSVKLCCTFSIERLYWAIASSFYFTKCYTYSFFFISPSVIALFVCYHAYTHPSTYIYLLFNFYFPFLRETQKQSVTINSLIVWGTIAHSYSKVTGKKARPSSDEGKEEKDSKCCIAKVLYFFRFIPDRFFFC